MIQRAASRILAYLTSNLPNAHKSKGLPLATILDATYQQVDAVADLIPEPVSFNDIDIQKNIVIDLIMRLMFQEGNVSLKRFADVIKLKASLIDDILSRMQNEHMVEVTSAGQLGRLSYQYRLTDSGYKRAMEAFERSAYIGPAPVTIDKYNELIMAQTQRDKSIPISDFRHALRHLVLPEGFEKQLGPAVNKGTSLFLYGPPGNGKTTIAESIAELVGGSDPIWLPYSLTIGGYIVNLYDNLVHQPHQAADSFRRRGTGQSAIDERWGLFKRPVVTVGGELAMNSLDLRYDETAKFYEAPLQMKANGGMFLIDDFGRQMMRPQELLNRWIVPLETGVDYLRLRTGQTMEIPFRQLIVFSTNLDPLDLADEAFLRRIQIKVLVDGPDKNMYYQIFKIMCDSMGIEFARDPFVHLLEKWYGEDGRELQACHPRDILKIIKAMCEFEEVPFHLSVEKIDAACGVYFVSRTGSGWSRAVNN